MLATNTDALSSAPSRALSDSVAECEPEEEDGWIVVKKQKITILVPPPSPLHPQSRSLHPQSRSPEKTEPSSSALKKRWHSLTKDKQKELSATPPPANDSQADGTVISPRAHKPSCNPVDSPKKFEQSSLVKVNGNGKGTCARRKSINVTRSLPIGALNVVNRRVRAQNLERKLEGLGGLRRWLVSKGLDRFVKVFEREKVGKYQLVNLTMRMLKDMGTDAVGPRRKLIHAIDCLCQPYYFKALQ